MQPSALAAAAEAAPWRALLAASLARNEAARASPYLQLATVRPDGRPACRTVVFRGFLGDAGAAPAAGAAPDALTFTTDARSRKVAELGANPWAEACVYFTETREQWRLAGRVRLVGPADGDAALARARAVAWAALPPPRRAEFGWPPPGRPRAPPGGAPRPAPAGGPAGEPLDGAAPLDTFVLCVLAPAEVDRVDLAAERRQRFCLRAGGGGWTEEEINP